MFPNARLWIQHDEYSYYTGEAWQAGGSNAADKDDVLMLVKLNTERRVQLIKNNNGGDNQEILPGIRVFTGGRHTYASQYVSVNTASGTAVVASDNLYLYENLERRAAIAQTLDAASNLRAQERMKQLALQPRLIVPGHDPAVFVKFPQPANGVAKIE